MEELEKQERKEKEGTRSEGEPTGSKASSRLDSHLGIHKTQHMQTDTPVSR